MNIEITSFEDITIAKFVGRFDSSVSAVARQKLSPIAKNGGKIILDLTEVEYGASTFYRMILETYRDIRTIGGKMVLFHPPDRIVEAMAINGFTSIFQIFDKLDLAIAELKK